jgi:hypothetical protein
VTPELLDLFKRAVAGDREAEDRFDVITKLPPWRISVFEVDDIPEPPGGPEDYVTSPWLRSWWEARAFRDALDRAARGDA